MSIIVMNDDDFEENMRFLSSQFNPVLADSFRARDTAQRETLEAWKAAHAREAAALAQAWEQRDIAQAQLAEAVGLLRNIEYAQKYGWEDSDTEALQAFLARHAQVPEMTAEQSAAISQRTRDAYVTQAEQQESQPLPRDLQEDILMLTRKAEANRQREALATQPAEKWIACSDRLPEVSEGCQQEFIVCAKRNHSGKLVVMSALYLNAYPLYCDHEDEAADEDGNIPHTGWYDAKSNGDDANCYSEIDDSRYAYGAKVTHWMPLPQPAAVRGAEHE